MDRRKFLKKSAAVTLGFGGLQSFVLASCKSSSSRFGSLQQDPEKVMDLPKGFTCRVLAKEGEMMSDGFFRPGCPDGMAAFPGPDGKVLLVCNHEIEFNKGPFGKNNELFEKLPVEYCYDPADEKEPCVGGTTTLVYDPKLQKLEKQFLSLVGTIRNCAGGPTPWNSWISCEETDNIRANEVLKKDHGFNFEVPATQEIGLVKPVPLTAMGRFRHEAVAIDEKTGIVYQTEDRDDGLIYRYIPNDPRHLEKGGKLQALKVKEQPSLDTRNWGVMRDVPLGAALDVEWIDMEDVLAPEDDLRFRGYDAGAARFARGEGMWTGSDGIYFACTSGGGIQKGQIWKYIPSPNEGQLNESDTPGKLVLFIEPNNPSLVDSADNLTVAPWGDIILCEDTVGDVNLVGVTPAGEIYKLACNAYDDSELAGVCFSPDGSTLFVNIYGGGLTVAITGPWRQA